jgi:large subunit ribosomal protein L21
MAQPSPASTYAIVETGGKQLWAEPGRFYDVELLEQAEETILTFQPLFLNHEGTVTLGHPYVTDAVVQARVMGHRRSRKVIVYKMKPKKKTRKKNGHRQHFTRLMIESISFKGVILASAENRPVFGRVERIEGETEVEMPSSREATE